MRLRVVCRLNGCRSVKLRTNVRISPRAVERLKGYTATRISRSETMPRRVLGHQKEPRNIQWNSERSELLRGITSQFQVIVIRQTELDKPDALSISFDAPTQNSPAPFSKLPVEYSRTVSINPR